MAKHAHIISCKLRAQRHVSFQPPQQRIHVQIIHTHRHKHTHAQTETRATHVIRKHNTKRAKRGERTLASAAVGIVTNGKGQLREETEEEEEAEKRGGGQSLHKNQEQTPVPTIHSSRNNIINI